MKTITIQTYKIFWQHAKQYSIKFWIITITIILGHAVGVIIPLYYKQFFDLISSGLPIAMILSNLRRILIIILLWNGLSWIMWRVASFANTTWQPRVMSDILNTCFNYLHQHSFGFFINKFVGSLVRKINRLVNSFEAISDAFFWNFLGTAFKIIAITIIVSLYNITLGLILSGWIIIYLTVNYALTMRKLIYDEASAACDSRVTGYLSDSLTNNINVKLFTAHDYEATGFDNITNEQYVLRKKSWRFDVSIEGVQTVFMIGLEFILFWWGIKFWQQGIITAGTFVLIQAYLIHIFERLWDFGRIIRKVYQHLADAEEMVEILNTPHHIHDLPNCKNLIIKNAEIEFKKVNFTYHAGQKIINNLNLHLKSGERVGLIGPSGAGKSTIVGLLFRFFNINTGGIFIDGQNIAQIMQTSLREQISLVPQDPILFHRTLMDNIRYGRRSATNDEVLIAAKTAHCDEFINALPNGYNTLVGERGIKLSGGERQRVAIARAILKNAPILVLDEATSSLDSATELLIQDALEKLMHGKTVLVIAHRLSTIMKMDKIVVIKNGQVQEIGTHQQLIKKSQGLYKKLWELQAGGYIK